MKRIIRSISLVWIVICLLLLGKALMNATDMKDSILTIIAALILLSPSIIYEVYRCIINKKINSGKEVSTIKKVSLIIEIICWVFMVVLGISISGIVFEIKDNVKKITVEEFYNEALTLWIKICAPVIVYLVIANIIRVNTIIKNKLAKNKKVNNL